MAKLSQKRVQNVDGDFFVDDTCIDCGTCYWMAPQIFSEVDGQSAVMQQPQNSKHANRALEAVLSCPTFSIGAENHAEPLKNTKKSFPKPLRNNVYHMGFHSEKSFGATSYFIKRAEGNLLIDSPRFQKHLVDKLNDFGGVHYQYLTHKDDVADTDLYWQHFQSERIIHQKDASFKSRDYEIFLKGFDPYQLADDLTVIPVPGHTEGSTVLLYKDILFTGDHLAWSQTLKHLYAFKTACWYDFDIQIESMEKLLQYDFVQILPGHGAPFLAESILQMKDELQTCINWMKNDS